MKIRKGDEVKIILGRDRSKSGKVEKVLKTGKVVVAGVNVYKRHVSPKRFGQEGEGGIVDIQKPINLSNVMLICPDCRKPTRVGFGLDKGKKKRICKKCGKEVDHEQTKK